MVYFEIFNAVSGSDAQKRARQDFDDLQNEVAGRDVGRIERFLTGGEHGAEATQKRRQERETTLFVAMIRSAEYARLYEELGQRLRDTRRFLDDAREQLAAIRAQIDADEQDILSRTVRLPDGTYVFRGDDDRAYTRDGELSDHPDAKDIIWRDDHAKLSEIQRNEDRAEKADRLESKLDRADARHGDISERYENTDEKMAQDEMKGALQGLDDIVADISAELDGLKKANTIEDDRKAEFEIPTSLPNLK